MPPLRRALSSSNHGLILGWLDVALVVDVIPIGRIVQDIINSEINTHLDSRERLHHI